MERYCISNRYSIIKRIKKIVNKLSDYMTGSVNNPKEIAILINEFEFLLKIIKTQEQRFNVPKNVVDRFVIFLETFKQYSRLRNNIAPGAPNLAYMENFLLEELGVNEKKSVLKPIQLPKYLLI